MAEIKEMIATIICSNYISQAIVLLLFDFDFGFGFGSY